MKDFIKLFTYGQGVRLSLDGEKTAAVLVFSDFNSSFLELVSSDFRILKFLSIFQLLSLQKLPRNFALAFRMKNRKEDFKILCESQEQQDKLHQAFVELIEEAERNKISEFSIKNMVRYTLYFSKIATVGGDYSLQTVHNLLFKLRIKLDDETLRKLIRKSVLTADSVSNFDIRRIFKILLLKEEASVLFKQILKISANEKIKKKKITLVELKNWIEEEQQQLISEKEITKIFTALRAPNIFKPPEDPVVDIDFEEFSSFLFSPFNSVRNPETLNKPLDDSAPLCEYFIATSHNTYLDGHQLSGTPGWKPYLWALDQGYRCLEIDCWDGPNNDPIVTNGSAQVSSFSFKELIDRLAPLAFHHSNYPLILNFELNCSKAQRDSIAKTLTSTFGDKLHLLRKDDFLKETGPSLASLKNKVLVLCKASYPGFVDKDRLKGENPIEEKQEFLHTLASLVIEKYAEAGLKTPFGTSILYESFLKRCQMSIEHTSAFIEFSKTNLAIIQPDKERIDSSNLNPIKVWSMGGQMAALNVQTFDKSTFLNQIRFMEGNNSGFVLKPKYLREKTPFNFLDDVIRKSCFVKILSTQILDQTLLDDRDYVFPFVEMQILGNEKDERANPKVSTKIFQNNLFHSVYNDISSPEGFTKLNLVYPELAFLYICVKDAKNGALIKHSAVSVESLRQGVRSLELYDANNWFDGFSYALLDVAFHKN